MATLSSSSSGSFRIVKHLVPGEHIREYPAATANEQEETLCLAVKQYIPLDNPNPQPGDVTILGAHANGFPKVRVIIEIQCGGARNGTCSIETGLTSINYKGTLRTTVGGNLRPFEGQWISHP